MGKRIGKQTVEITSKPRIIATYTVVGPKEAKGPLNEYFDNKLPDDLNGKDSYEKAESSIMAMAIKNSIKKAKLQEGDINYIFAGDLLNQISSSNFAMRDIKVPFIGLYGACSTMAESIGVASIFMDGNFANHVLACTSSHFSSAERQFRLPLEMGSQRAPTAQWTVTGSGAAVLGKEGNYPYITHVTTGMVVDYNITDPSNMGAAMAPAAVDTIYKHFQDTGRSAKDYDLIATGDLGKLGKKLTEEMLIEYGYDIRPIYTDCGIEIFNMSDKNINCGGSGCGCSAVVFCGCIYKNMMCGKLKRVLLVSTGALLSTTSSLQGESVPGIAHAVAIEYGGNKDE